MPSRNFGKANILKMAMNLFLPRTLAAPGFGKNQGILVFIKKICMRQ